MKSKNHIQLNLLTVLTINFLIFHILDIYGLEYIFSILKINITVLYIYMVMGNILFLIGSILPDSDSDNKGSKIFYTPLMPVAYLLRLVEIILSLRLGKRRGHRQLLHKPIGIIVSSLMIVSIMAWILLQINAINIFIFAYLYLCLLVGQLTHVIQDQLHTITPIFSKILYLILLILIAFALYHAV